MHINPYNGAIKRQHTLKLFGIYIQGKWKMETLVDQSNVLFILLGAIMVLAMHAGFAFLEVGTVR